MSQSNFQLGGGGGEFNFLTPLIRNSGTPYVLKICSAVVPHLYQRKAMQLNPI